MVPLAIGTDTGGSIRVPSSYCGIVGFKPTHGRVSRQGVFPLSRSLDHVGPMSRTVRDVALLLDVLEGPANGTSIFGRTRTKLGPPWPHLRVGVLREHLESDLQPGTLSAFKSALMLFVEDGVTLVDVTIPLLKRPEDELMSIVDAEAASVHEKWLRSRPDDYSPMARQQLEAGLRVTAIRYNRAQQYRSQLASEFASAFTYCDVLVSPTVAHVAPTEDIPITVGVGTRPIRQTSPYNLTGLPAITVPCGLGDGQLPVGIQIAGPWMRDYHVIQVAEEFEARCGFAHLAATSNYWLDLHGIQQAVGSSPLSSIRLCRGAVRYLKQESSCRRRWCLLWVRNPPSTRNPEISRPQNSQFSSSG